MCMPLCACGQKKAEEKDTTARIELTTDNLSSFISFSVSSDESNISSELVKTRPYKKYKYWGSVDLTVKAFLKSGIRLKNASFTIRCHNSNTVDGESPWDDIDILVKMSANGEMVTTTRSSNSVPKSKAFSYSPTFTKTEVISVSGCVIISTE